MPKNGGGPHIRRLLAGGTDKGFVRLPSQKHVPSHQYGFTRYPSSGDGGMAEGGKMPKMLEPSHITSGEAVNFPTMKEAEPVLSLLPKHRYVDSLSQYVNYSPEAELLRRVPQMALGGRIRNPAPIKFIGGPEAGKGRSQFALRPKVSLRGDLSSAAKSVISTKYAKGGTVEPKCTCEGGKMATGGDIPLMPNNLLKLRMLRDFGPTFARGGPVKKTVDIKEQSHGYPIVRHEFRGDTAEEALHYLNSHKKSDDFMRDCLAKGKYQDVPCSARSYADGGSVAPYLRNVALHPEAERALPAVSYVESRHNPEAVGPMTKYGRALGEYQMLPSTAKDLAVDPRNPEQAKSGAHLYLSWLIGQTGSLKNAIAAYNMGLGTFKKLGDNPKNWPKETQDYVDKVIALLSKNEAGQQPTIASAPLNPSDTTPQPDTASVDTTAQAPADITAPSGPSQATSTIGGGGGAPALAKYPPIRASMKGTMSPGNKNPMEMVATIMKNPLALSMMED